MTEKNINETEQKKEYLNEYRKIRYKIKSLEEQKRSLIETMRSAKAIKYSDMPKGCKQSDLSDYIVKLDILISDIEENEKALMNKRLDIENHIIQMKDGIECDILRKRYIELKPWESICIEMSYSWKQIHRYHSRALKNFIMT